MKVVKRLSGLASVALVAVVAVGASGAFAGDKAKADAPTKAVAELPLKQMSPHQVVDSVTTQLMQVVSHGKDSMKSNPDAYFAEVQKIMEKVVDFDYIAKNVMGARYWNTASPDQRTRFVSVFTDGLVQTYAKGMANFADLDISVEPPSEDIGDKKRVAVIQKFEGPEGVNNVAYTMGKHKSGEWRLINVVLDGVNLGETLRSQFAQAVAENKGDLDATISGWQLKS